MGVKKILLYTIIIIVLGIGFCLFAFYQSVTDTKNVNIEGYVYDKITKKSINGVTVIVNNERYESDNGTLNYDEYLGHDVIKLTTDESGYYSTTIEKSAFLWIDFEKEGYMKAEEKGLYSSKRMTFKTLMKKQY